MFDKVTTEAIAEIAKKLSVPTASLLAVAEVESGGRVLAKVGEKYEPIIRFEGHYFDRFLRGAPRIEARKAGLASPVPGRVRNPRSQAARWKKLDKAIAINRIAALSSCSWGLGQVMGSHWKWLGYGSVDALVEEARSGVSGQVRLMARYIEKAGLCDALRKQNWRKFARTYNGPGYAKNRYDVKMAQAFTRYRRPAAQQDLPEVADDETRLMFGSRGAEVKKLQKQLSHLGYVLRPDGLFGLVTDRTVRAFQRDNCLEETGIITKAERNLLNASGNRMAASLISLKTGLARSCHWRGRRGLKRFRDKMQGWGEQTLSLLNRFN